MVRFRECAAFKRNIQAKAGGEGKSGRKIRFGERSAQESGSEREVAPLVVITDGKGT